VGPAAAGTLSLDSVGTEPSSAAARAVTTELAERALARAFG
jgi:hypothetical protein